MPDLEPLITDSRLNRIIDRLHIEFPRLYATDSTFVTMIVPPGSVGHLPDGTTGPARWPLGRFLVFSPNPRPLARRNGIQHGTDAVVWLDAWRASEKQRGHYVVTGDDPAFKVFRLLARQHLSELDSLASIMN